MDNEATEKWEPGDRCLWKGGEVTLRLHDDHSDGAWCVEHPSGRLAIAYPLDLRPLAPAPARETCGCAENAEPWVTLDMMEAFFQCAASEQDEDHVGFRAMCREAVRRCKLLKGMLDGVAEPPSPLPAGGVEVWLATDDDGMPYQYSDLPTRDGYGWQGVNQCVEVPETSPLHPLCPPWENDPVRLVLYPAGAGVGREALVECIATWAQLHMTLEVQGTSFYPRRREFIEETPAAIADGIADALINGPLAHAGGEVSDDAVAQAIGFLWNAGQANLAAAMSALVAERDAAQAALEEARGLVPGSEVLAHIRKQYYFTATCASCRAVVDWLDRLAAQEVPDES